jgi:hypothetical protein
MFILLQLQYAQGIMSFVFNLKDKVAIEEDGLVRIVKRTQSSWDFFLNKHKVVGISPANLLEGL